VFSGGKAPIDKLNNKKLTDFLSVLLIDLLHRFTTNNQYALVTAIE
tara:strand:+ start:829 stop:966 length:138 start_codon:yes stop_codon:yes gene_type:complete